MAAWVAACHAPDPEVGGPTGGTPTGTTPPDAVCAAGVAAVNGPDAYGAVGEALAAATAGSVVRICAGTWEVDGAVGTGTIEIRGDTGDAADVVLRPPATGGTILRHASSTAIALAHLTLEGATASAVAIPAVGSLSILGCVFRDNGSDLGGGAVAAAISRDAAYATHLDVQDSVFERNTAPQGGALDLAMSGDAVLSIVGTRFEGNTADGLGGAIALFPASGATNTLLLEGAELVGNTAADGGALAFTGPGVLVGAQVVATDNVASNAGGAFVFARPISGTGAIDLTGGAIARNVAGAVLSGAIHMEPGWSLTASAVDFGAAGDDNEPKDVNVCAAQFDGPATFDAPGC